MRYLSAIVLLGTTLGLQSCGGGGGECSATADCDAATFCVEGSCTADCDPAAPMCDDGICTSNGRCARDQPDPDANVCAAMVLEATFGIPTIQLVVDQSGSMNQPYPGGTRWTVLRDALIDPTNGVVTQLQDSIRFGLTMFSSDEMGMCPDLISVTPALNNLDGISTEYAGADPQSQTPTGESIEAVAQDLAAFSEPGRKVIVLATDGEPDTCAVPDPGNQMERDAARLTSVTAVENAYAQGIDVFIISVGEGAISTAHLQDLANAGAGLPVGGTENADFYDAGNAAEIADAFAAITSQVLSCDLDVNGEIDPRAVATGTIFLDGDPLTINTPNGWEAIDNNSFRLLGNACDQAQRTGNHVVTAEFGCTTPLAAPGLEVVGGGLAGGCACSEAWSPPALLGLAALVLVGRRRRQSCKRS